MPTVTQMVTPTLVSKLFSEHWSVIKGIVGTNNDRLINTLFHTLDYVSNRTPPSDDAVVEGAALAWLIERVSAAIKLIMLKQLGFDEDKLINIISTRPRFIQLKTIKEPWGVT
jgi:hypothetical protein